VVNSPIGCHTGVTIAAHLISKPLKNKEIMADKPISRILCAACP